MEFDRDATSYASVELTDGVVTVRTPVPTDASTIAELVRDNLEALLPWMVWAHADYSQVDAHAWITNKLEPTAHPLLVIDADGAIVGSTGLNNVNTMNRTTSLGYWLATKGRGKGYASRSTDLVARWAIEQLGFQRVEICMSVHNEPSRRVAERSIARYEGILRQRSRYGDLNHDVHVYSVVRADLA